MEKNNDVLVVICHFGLADFATVPLAPRFAPHELLFANDVALLPWAAERGWQPRFLGGRLPLSRNSTVSSLQSKYVKFLQFLVDNPDQYYGIRRVVYYDTKESLRAEHLSLLWTPMAKGSNE